MDHCGYARWVAKIRKIGGRALPVVDTVRMQSCGGQIVVVDKVYESGGEIMRKLLLVKYAEGHTAGWVILMFGCAAISSFARC